MASWHRHYGKWWMVQWAFDGWISLGVHIDFRFRRRANKERYAPYIDIHLLFIIVSIGLRPVYTGDIELRTSTAIAREL